jgi:hypothetical protein
MVAVRYGGVVEQPGSLTCAGRGVQPGPVGGDGWQQIFFLPSYELPAGTGRYAIHVTGKVHNIQRLASVGSPSRAVLQVCLGFDTGSISPVHQFCIPLASQSGALEGIPFGFVMLQDAAAAISDPFFGGSFNNSGGAQFCLWARVFCNGDAPTFNYSFDVAEVTWLWFDTDRIDAADKFAAHFYPATPTTLTTTASLPAVSGLTPFAAGEKWLHFQSVTYEPPNGPRGTLAAPILRHGYTTTGFVGGFVAKAGTNGRWAQSHGDQLVTAGAASAVPVLSAWAFWYHEMPSGTVRPALAAQDRQSTSASKVRRWTSFSLCLDNLLDVLTRVESSVQNATSNRYGNGPAEGAAYVALERPATGVVSEPCILAHAIVLSPGRNDYEIEVRTESRVLRPHIIPATTRANLNEGASLMAMTRTGLSATVPDLQYRFPVIGGLNAEPQSLTIADVYLVQFNLVRDPEGVPAIPPTVGDPVAISLGREAPALGSLSVLPVAPDAAVGEEFEAAMRGRIDALNGQSPSWPLFTRPRRFISLQWSGLTEAQKETLDGFIATTPIFKFTLPGESSPVALLADENGIELAQIVGGAFFVSLSCVELTWTN